MDSSYFGSPAVMLSRGVEKLKWGREFGRTVCGIDSRLEKDIPQALRERLMIEKEILKRIPGQYPYTWAEAPDMLWNNVRDLKDCELETLWGGDAVNWVYVDGEMRFRSNFLENVLKTRKEYKNQAMDLELVRSKAESLTLLSGAIAFMKERGGAGCRFHVRGIFGILEEAGRGDENIEVYPPLLIEYVQTKNMRIHSVRIGGRGAEAQEYTIARPDAFQRAIRFRTKHKKGQKCLVEFSFGNREAYKDFSRGSLKHGDPEYIKERTGTNGFAKPMDAWLAQQPPHIRFIPLIRELASNIMGEGKDPLKEVRKMYDCITTRVMHLLARSYPTLTDIARYAASSLKGDCGVQALLLITLCRATDVPAGWQAGLYTSPLETGCHDWAQLYAPSHGRCYTDCFFGGAAFRGGETERWNFYSGSLDPFRLPAARGLGYRFGPPMDHLRNGPYGNRTGETEYKNRNLAQEEYNTEYEIISLEDIAY